ncbi:hypothetical protein CsatB_013658 [Cannabis sativa]
MEVLSDNGSGVRLDEHNYLPWKHQVFVSIKGSKLQRFLEPDRTPPQFLPEEDKAVNRVSAEYKDWDQQDSILVSWLLSSMSEKILTRIVGCETAAQIWSTLKVYVTTLNHPNIGQYRTLLRSTKMQNSLGDFLPKIKWIVDILSSIEHQMTPQDHIEAIFNGLPSDYDVFITCVNTRLDVYYVAKIEALLMTQEVRLEKGSKELDINKPEANLAHTKPYHGSRGTFSSPHIP